MTSVNLLERRFGDIIRLVVEKEQTTIRADFDEVEQKCGFIRLLKRGVEVGILLNENSRLLRIEYKKGSRVVVRTYLNKNDYKELKENLERVKDKNKTFIKA